MVDEELTEFAFTTDSVCYAGDHIRCPPDAYDSRGGFHGSQEWEFRKQRLSDLPDDTVTGLPMLTHTPAAWVAVTEADLTDWAGLWLVPRAPGGGNDRRDAQGRLAPRWDGDGPGEGLAAAPLPMEGAVDRQRAGPLDRERRGA